jgi:hypothetical protein
VGRTVTLMLVSRQVHALGDYGSTRLTSLFHATKILYTLEPRLTLRHSEGPRTLAAGRVSATERPCTGDRIPSHCSRQIQRIAARRSRYHLETKLARHVAIKVSGQGERAALRLSRYKARLPTSACSSPELLIKS